MSRVSLVPAAGHRSAGCVPVADTNVKPPDTTLSDGVSAREATSRLLRPRYRPQ